MKVLKFGGTSLANGEGITNSISIIEKASKEPIVIVVSARGKSTDILENILNNAVSGKSFEPDLKAFLSYQQEVLQGADFESEYEELTKLLEAVQLIGDFNEAIKDRVMAYGELISAKTIVELLNSTGIKSRFIDSRKLIKTAYEEGEVSVLQDESAQLTKAFFSDLKNSEVPVVTGFIASDMRGNTTTLGRNGTNYTATLLAKFCDAEEVQNWTNIDGVYTANPSIVKDARKIEKLTYREANELANFGANILHAKTILPLIEKSIPITILNTFEPDKPGTTINKEGSGKGIKAVSVIEDVALVSIEGRGLMGKVGIDARIFTLMSQNAISIRMISQASSERGIGFIINQKDGKLAKKVLQKEFAEEIKNKDISEIDVNPDLAIIAIIGRHNYALEKAISGLRKNKIWMYLINNSINGEQISLVVANNDLKKAVNVVHNQVFGAVKTLNIIAFGKGTVGGTFVNQVINTKEEIIRKRKLKLNIVGVADSKKFLFNPDGIDKNWRTKLKDVKRKSIISEMIDLVNESGLENVVIVDNTASKLVTDNYVQFVKQGYDLISSNKIGNSISYGFYDELRIELSKKKKSFLYETNVGAGLPLIDTIRLLHLSGEEVNKIRGVFSGSLSYIFNNFSLREKNFSEVLAVAKENGLTEPDPREDLSGNDVARKLLILAREIGMKNELEDVVVQNLIPDQMSAYSGWDEFIAHIDELDTHYSKLLSKLPDDKVFRYVGELDKSGKLKVELVEVDKTSSLGNLSGSDSIFEIYTDAYQNNPITIMGAGAGAEVTARGVYSDLLRLGSMI